MEKDGFDIAKLIRSIQRAEGHPDCFRKNHCPCELTDCVWRSYCLEGSQNQTHENGGPSYDNGIVVHGMDDGLEDHE